MHVLTQNHFNSEISWISIFLSYANSFNSKLFKKSLVKKCISEFFTDMLCMKAQLDVDSIGFPSQTLEMQYF